MQQDLTAMLLHAVNPQAASSMSFWHGVLAA